MPASATGLNAALRVLGALSFPLDVVLHRGATVASPHAGPPVEGAAWQLAITGDCGRQMRCRTEALRVEVWLDALDAPHSLVLPRGAAVSVAGEDLLGLILR